MLWRARRRGPGPRGGGGGRGGGFPPVGRVLFAAPLAERPALADLRGLVDPKLEGLDDPDAAVRTDGDLPAAHVIRGRAFKVHLLALNPVRDQLARAPEDPAGPADVDLAGLDHGD